MVGFREEISDFFDFPQLHFKVQHACERETFTQTWPLSLSTRWLWKECRLSEPQKAQWSRDCVLKEISPDMVFLYCLCVVSKFPGLKSLSLKSLKFNLFAWLDGAFWSPTAEAMIVQWIWALAEPHKQRPGNSPEGSGSCVCFDSADWKCLNL